MSTPIVLPSDLPMVFLSYLPWSLPAAYLAGWAFVLLLPGRAWQIAGTAASVGLAGILAACLAAISAGTAAADGVSLLVGLMVGFIGWVVVRYSRRYLDGEGGQIRYVAALSFTLAAASTVVVTGHLGVLVVAWAASSLGLHHLLTFYRERPAAQVAAHKKFLVSRFAELLLAAALVLIGIECGTLTLDGIAAHVAGLAVLPVALHAAAVLVALAAILKSAQLPLHGWLIQVMEAPTPVSALLHAGIVNIGGYVLLRLAALLGAASAASALLVIVGGLTAVLAGLVMMTRISIKVRLAWSTCAQMGFLLMEVGLGLYELALLHLVAHSFYKAHAFLAAGDTVNAMRARDLLPTVAGGTPVTRGLARLAALPATFSLVVACAWLWHLWLPARDVPMVAIGIVAVGLAPLLWAEGAAGKVRGAVRVALLAQLYLVWHFAFALAVAPDVTPSPLLLAWVAACFGLFYLLQVWISVWPQGSVASYLHPRVYAGFWLDEWFTRAVFRLWPPGKDTAVRGPAGLGQQGDIA